MIYDNWKNYYEAEGENATLDCENGADEDLQVSSVADELSFGGKSREEQYYISSYDSSFVRIFVGEQIESVIKQLKSENISIDFILKIAEKSRVMVNAANALYDDGINDALIAAMSDEEILQSFLYEDYNEYNDFMTHMAEKYDV